MGPQHEDRVGELPWGLEVASRGCSWRVCLLDRPLGSACGNLAALCLPKLLLIPHGRAPTSQHLHLQEAGSTHPHILSRPATGTATWLLSSWLCVSLPPSEAS